MENYENNNSDHSIDTQVKELASAFDTEEIKMLKEKLAVEKKQKMELEAKKEKHTQFKTLFDATLSDPTVAPFKDLVEETVKENPEFKDLGESGVSVVLKLAKQKMQSKTNPVNEQPAIDDLPKGDVDSQPGRRMTLNQKGVPVNAEKPYLIDWKQVDLDKLDPLTKDFVLMQRQIQTY